MPPVPAHTEAVYPVIKLLRSSLLHLPSLLPSYADAPVFCMLLHVVSGGLLTG